MRSEKTAEEIDAIAEEIQAIARMVQGVSRQIGRFSRHAGVFTEPGKPAGAHDLRRSFGTRWASLVMPQVLMRIMRHESISTTMRYYVTADAARTSREMRAALGDFSGDMATPARSY